MISVMNFELDHFDMMVPKTNEVTLEDFEAYLSFGNTIVHTLYSNTLGVVAFIGGMIIRKGVMEIWMLPSINIDKCKLSLIKVCRKILENAFVIYNLRRIQMTIASADLWKWAEMMGFSFEAKLRGYAPDGSREYLFSRVP